jgi:acyl carrier protein
LITTNLRDEALVWLKRQLSAQLGVDASKITEGSTFDDLHFDSLDGIELAMATEEKFEIEISNAEADKATDVRSFLDIIVAKIN